MRYERSMGSGSSQYEPLAPESWFRTKEVLKVGNRTKLRTLLLTTLVNFVTATSKVHASRRCDGHFQRPPGYAI